MNNIKYKLATMTLCSLFATSVFANTQSPIRLVIHGGAGTITKDTITPEQEKEYKEKLTEALNAGYAVLNSGGTSIEAVQKSINVMEDSPLFNAGKGAVFTHDGRNELDASIMDGKTRNAGAVAGVTTVKNPINAAIAVMEKSPHVLMVSNGADLFAKEQGPYYCRPFLFSYRTSLATTSKSDRKRTSRFRS